MPRWIGPLTAALLVLLSHSSVRAFTMPAATTTLHAWSSASRLSALTTAAVAEGEREILDGPNGPVLVTKVAGTYYAVDATCPHVT